MSFPLDVCPDVDGLEPFRGERNRQFTRDEAFFYDHLCRASLPWEHTGAAVTSMKGAEVWSILAEWIRALAAVATLYPEQMKKQAFPGRGSPGCGCWLMAAATFQRYQWYLNHARLRSTVACQQAALLGTRTRGKEALHAELGGVFRQAYNVSVPTFRLKLDLFKHSKQASFDGARRIPLLRQRIKVLSILGMFEVIPVRKCHRRSHHVSVPIPPLHEVKSWRGSSGTPCSVRGAGRGTAVTPWPRGELARRWAASRPVDAPRRSASAKRVLRRGTPSGSAPCSQRAGGHNMSGGGTTRGMRAACAQ